MVGSAEYGGGQDRKQEMIRMNPLTLNDCHLKGPGRIDRGEKSDADPDPPGDDLIPMRLQRLLEPPVRHWIISLPAGGAGASNALIGSRMAKASA